MKRNIPPINKYRAMVGNAQKDAEKKKNALDGAKRGNGVTISAVKQGLRQAKRAHRWLGAVPFLLTLFSLFFLVSRVMGGGFYVGVVHTVALLTLISFAGALVLLLLVFFLLKRCHRQTGRFLVRWWLQLGAILLSVFCRICLKANGFLVLALLIGLFALFFEVFRRGNSGRKPVNKASVRVVAVFCAALVAFCVVIAVGGLASPAEGTFAETDAFGRNVRYDTKEEGVALGCVMLNVRDMLNLGEDAVFTVPETVPVHKQDTPVIAIGERAFAGVRTFDEVSLPATVREIGPEAFCHSDVHTLYIIPTDSPMFTNSRVAKPIP